MERCQATPSVLPDCALPASVGSQLVAGSVVMAFGVPRSIDLIHKNYRKLCNLLIDVEEWGQVVIISMLTRYALTQFLQPHPEREWPGPPGATATHALTVGRRASRRRCPLPHPPVPYPSPPHPQESLLEENSEKAFYGSEERWSQGPGV